MALQREAAPLDGEAYTEIYGETKSDEDYDEETEEDDFDLEEGEIVDSGAEEEKKDEIENKEERESIADQEEISQPLPIENKPPIEERLARLSERPKEKYSREMRNEKLDKRNSRHSDRNSQNKRSKYNDLDSNVGEDEKGSKEWYQRSRNRSKEESLDYRKELSMYSSSPKNSPERDSKGEKKRKRSAAAISKLKAKKNAAKRAKLRLLEKSGKIVARKYTIKRPCKFYLEGGCSKGEQCVFMHVRSEKQKKELCRFYLNGHCTKGRQCIFMHEEFPCKFFHTGAECYSGENCRFSHKPLNDETKKLLQECLKGYSNSNEDHTDRRKRQKSKSPDSLSKRVCLLGSPPRHIREAEETKRWQEEMIHLQKEKSTKAFQIRLNANDSPNDPKSSPSGPNFYVDTMKSPQNSGGEENQGGIQNMNPGENNFDDRGPPPGNRNFNDHGPSGNPNFMPLGPGPNFGNARPGANPNFPLMGPAMTPNFGTIRPPVGNRNFANMGPRGNPNFRNLRPPGGMPNFSGIMGPANANFIGPGGFGNRRPIMNPNFTHPPPNFFHPGQEGKDLRPPDFNWMNMPRNNFNPQGNIDFGEAKAVVYEDLMENSHNNLNYDADEESRQDGGSTPPSPDNFEPRSPTHEPSSGGNSPNEEKDKSIEKDPIVIPRSLPRKQQELFLRIQRHQKTKSADDSNEGTGDEGTIPAPLETVPQKEEDENFEDKTWMSSDDDDDGDKPLTAVLKKLGQAPPPKPKELPPQKPQLDLSQMLSNIMQKASVNNNSSALNPEQGKFWQNILSGVALSAKHAAAGSPSASSSVVIGNNTLDSNKRRPSLQESKPCQDKIVKESRDPRLKSRDPRTAANKPTLVPNSSDTSSKPILPPPPILPLEPLTTTVHHRRDLNSIVPSSISAVVVDGLQGNIPYKLHVVSVKPLNYSIYVQASHSDPKLLNDPRLRKLISLESKSTPTNAVNVLEVPAPPPTLPDLPLFNPLPLQDNSTSSNMSSQPLPTNVPHLQEIKPISQSADPRTKRIEQRRPSGSTTPPFAPGGDNRIATPNIPTVASHLPRAIADPRMAKLHKPQDPRRSRLTLDVMNKTNQTDKPSNSKISDTNEPQDVEVVFDSTSTTKITEPEEEATKNKLDEKKIKAVQRNRKSSMEYASPLNSCNDNSSGVLNYNSYNQRPPPRPRNVPEVPSIKDTLPNLGTPEFSASDNSNLDCDSLDTAPSIRDMFKTIDPTASPFC